MNKYTVPFIRTAEDSVEQLETQNARKQMDSVPDYSSIDSDSTVYAEDQYINSVNATDQYMNSVNAPEQYIPSRNI